MIKQQIKNLGERLSAFENSTTGKRIMKLVSLLFTAAIIAYLIYKLALIGWDNVWRSLPQTPWFYVLMLAIYFTLPVFQVMIYRVAWKTHTSSWQLFLALLKKRALDKDFMGYSGEMYLYLWARKNVGKSDKEIFHVLKDNVILSSASSTLVALVLLVVFFAFGRVKLPENWLNPTVTDVSVAILCIILVIGLAAKFRKRIFHLKRKQVFSIFGLHISRLLVVQGLQVVQWMMVMPEVPMVNWMTLLAAQIIITRLPLLPSRDLIFMGTGIEMSQYMDISATSMAGMLLAASVLSKILNLLFFVVVFFTNTRKKNETPIA